VKKIKCTKCTTIFEIRNPAAVESEAVGDETGPLNSPILGSDDFSLDTTVMGRSRMKSAVAGAGIVPPPLPVSKPSAPHSTDKFPAAVASSRADERRLRLPENFRLSLACLSGPDSGRIFDINKARMTMGRANADIVLTDAQCSRQHAAIEVLDDQVFVVDLGSTNGTFFGERRIERMELDNRAEFDLGGTTMMLIKTSKD
jgi:hypothetical protein